MSYLVLARKYRPAFFSQVVGQEHVTHTLTGALINSRLAQAFCFTGPRGIGKTSVARILAKAINCERGLTPIPCGECIHCCGIDQGRSVDVQEIDAASYSRVEDIRDLREAIRYRPQAARYRIIILDEVHMLSKSAFNALLKTLEEPPKHTIFILATTDIYKVPLTILSRCQRYDFRRLAANDLSKHLKNILDIEGMTLPSESLALIAREADGSVRDALTLLDQILSSGYSALTHIEVVDLLGLVNYELVNVATKALLGGNAAQVLDVVAKIYAAGGEMQAFYSILLERFRNLIVAKVASIDRIELFGLTKGEIEELQSQAKEVSTETLHEFFNFLVRSEELFRRSTNPRLVMEMTLLRLAQIKPILSLTEIIERLTGVASSHVDILTNDINLTQALRPNLMESILNTQDTSQTLQDSSTAAQKLYELSRYTARVEPTLASYLQRASLQVNKEYWLITLPYSPLALDLVRPENEAKLNTLAAELWQNAPHLRLLVAPALPVPEPLSKGNNQDKIELKSLSSFTQHPIVQEALELFEAEIVSRKPLVQD